MDHLLDFAVGTGVLHGAVFVATSDTVVRLFANRLAFVLPSILRVLEERLYLLASAQDS